jgi:hypothetical protein
VLGQERHQLVALAGLAPAPLGVLLEPCILTHLRRATRTAGPWATVAKRRTRTTWTARTTVAKRRTWAARTTGPIPERRTRTTRATGPIPERWARATRTPIAKRRARTRGHTRHRWHAALKGCTLAAAFWPAEPLATARRATTAAVAAAALAATGAPTTGTTAATAATRPDRHVAAPSIVVVHPTTVHALASATALTVAIGAHLHDDRRTFVLHWRGRGWGDAKLLEICKLLQQRFLKTLSHPFSYYARAVPSIRAGSR